MLHDLGIILLERKKWNVLKDKPSGNSYNKRKYLLFDIKSTFCHSLDSLKQIVTLWRISDPKDSYINGAIKVKASIYEGKFECCNLRILILPLWKLLDGWNKLIWKIEHKFQDALFLLPYSLVNLDRVDNFLGFYCK